MATPQTRRWIAGGLICLTITATGYATHPNEKKPPGCTRAYSPGEPEPYGWKCSFPTASAKRAVIYVQPFEDGSAKLGARDPETGEFVEYRPVRRR